MSWAPSGGLVASVPTAGSKLANTNAMVTTFPNHSALMVLVFQPTLSEGFAPLTSGLFAKRAKQSRAPWNLHELSRRKIRPCISARRAREGKGWCLKYPWKLWCHLNEGVEQMLPAAPTNRSLDYALTPRSGGGVFHPTTTRS